MKKLISIVAAVLVGACALTGCSACSGGDMNSDTMTDTTEDTYRESTAVTETTTDIPIRTETRENAVEDILTDAGDLAEDVVTDVSDIADDIIPDGTTNVSEPSAN